MSLTQQDLEDIDKILEEKFEARTGNLPTKDEFFGQMDMLMDGLSKIRESQELMTHKVYHDHEERMETLEKKAGIQI